MSVTKTFTVDGVTYKVDFKHNKFSFCVVKAVKYDPFDKWDSPTEVVYHGRIPTKYVFRVKNELMAFVKCVLRAYKPPHFEFSGTTVDKNSVYLKVAKKLADEFGYKVYELGAGGSIICYKNA